MNLHGAALIMVIKLCNFSKALLKKCRDTLKRMLADMVACDAHENVADILRTGYAYCPLNRQI